MRSSFEIRKQFLEYFSSREHEIVESSALVPQNDPTLLFTNAGMVQFKSVFLGEETRSYKRATTSQKCVRAGGKHNDLENVGRTARHHTFFEMLGNFSFGDYFKEEAIRMAWEFLTRVMNISPERLWVTIFREDDEACKIWEAVPDLPEGRIVRLGEKDNFWSMGDVGPCGPCSEILIDQGEEFSCGRPDCRVGCDCDRYLELWNLVFMQFNRDSQGNKTPLPKPSIDTGLGLERLTAVLQGVKSNYDTDLFRPLLEFVEKISSKVYGSNPDHDTSMKVIADHSRAVAFLIVDGVMPSNEGRGYVLRRIMRRAARHGRLLDVKESFLHRAVCIVAQQMGDIYPEVAGSLEYIRKVVLNEENAFSATLDSGLKILEDKIEELKGLGEFVIPGDVAFKLYDTYGFPLDLTTDIVAEKAMTVDSKGFEAAMQQQRTRARQAWKGSGDDRVEAVYKDIVNNGILVSFKGYEDNETSSHIVAIVKNGQLVDCARTDDEVEIVADKTPFYGESGGQTGDRGTVSGDGFMIQIDNTVKPLSGLTVHRGRIVKGIIKIGDKADFCIDSSLRGSTAGNHTATHILHSVLRVILGGHVKQAGSLVTPERLRFDFTHFEAIGEEILREIEDCVNDHIRGNAVVETEIVPLKEAMQTGATALFGEKYGSEVRVVSIADYSKELCGGTHISSAGKIGCFKIISEGAIAAGVRRIEAVTGKYADLFIHEQEKILGRLSELLKIDFNGLTEKVEKLIAGQKSLEKEVQRFKGQLASKQAASILDEVKDISGIKVLVKRVDETDPRDLRNYGDKIRDRMGSGIIVFGAEDKDRAHLLCMVTRDIAQKFPAGEIIKQIAPIVEGRGGGRNDMAQAGGKAPEKLGDALDEALKIIEKMG